MMPDKMRSHAVGLSLLCPGLGHNRMGLDIQAVAWFAAAIALDFAATAIAANSGHTTLVLARLGVQVLLRIAAALDVARRSECPKPNTWNTVLVVFFGMGVLTAVARETADDLLLDKPAAAAHTTSAASRSV